MELSYKVWNNYLWLDLNTILILTKPLNPFGSTQENDKFWTLRNSKKVSFHKASEEQTLEFVDTIQEYLEEAQMFSEVVSQEDDKAEAGVEAGAREVLQDLLSNSAGESLEINQRNKSKLEQMMSKQHDFDDSSNVEV